MANLKAGIREFTIRGERDGYNKRDSGICDFEERDSRNNHIKRTEISRCEMIKRGIQNGSFFCREVFESHRDLWPYVCSSLRLS